MTKVKAWKKRRPWWQYIIAMVVLFLIIGSILLLGDYSSQEKDPAATPLAPPIPTITQLASAAPASSPVSGPSLESEKVATEKAEIAEAAPSKPEISKYVVSSGDTLEGVFGKEAKAVCEANSLKNCNLVRVGQELIVPLGVEAKTIVHTPVRRLADGSLPIARLGVAPYAKYRTPEKDRKILSGQGYTVAEIDEYLSLRDQGKCVREEFSRGTKFPWMAFGRGSVLKNLTAVWKQPEAGLVCQLQSGRNVVILDKCDNLTEVAPRTPQPPPIVTPPPKVEEPPVEPQPVPPPEEPEVMVPPFHVTPEEAAGKPRCEVQAGAGLYGNRMYEGNWVYGEAICYVWKDGAWQAGPGLYGMYGSGESIGTAFRNQEYGVGVQVGAQRNWVNDRNRLSTLDLKLRWLRDKSWGENPDSGYSFTQKGQKVGAYVGYTEKLNSEGDLAGVIGEYWKSYGQTVSSTWTAQPVQDRGSMSLSGFYETKLSQDNAWRQRVIGGWARTNWDKQDWLRGTYEIRYNEWLMFGPQVTLPIGVSDLNKPLSARDLTTVGAFVRVELGKKVRENDAKSREAQVEFIPAEAATPPK
ncbi:MAG: hypothetical protein WAV46_04625 [Candidatus Moraniibacteriota bacterium]